MAKRETRPEPEDSGILTKLNRLKDLEMRKRQLDGSSPEFEEVANAIAGVSSDIFRLGHGEEAAEGRVVDQGRVGEVEPNR